MRLAFSFVILAACGGGGGSAQGEDTGSTCPTVDPPTYASFGQPFFESYCLRCHSETRTGDDRHGAPPTIDFDSRTLVRMNTSDIDKQAAFGPTAMNMLMPDDDLAAPTDAERVVLGQYIACEIGR